MSVPSYQLLHRAAFHRTYYTGLRIRTTLISWARYHNPPCDAGRTNGANSFISTSHHTRPRVPRCGAAGCAQQCHPGRKANPFVGHASARSHSPTGMRLGRLMNNVPRLPSFRRRNSLKAVITAAAAAIRPPVISAAPAFRPANPSTGPTRPGCSCGGRRSR